MAFRRRSGSSWVTPNRIQRRSGNSWVDVQTIRRRSGSSWITVYTAYSSPTGTMTQVHGEYVDPTMPMPIPPLRTITAHPRMNVSGGTGGPYTYSWSITSGLAVIDSGASAIQCVISASVTNHSTVSGGIRCVVGDGVSTVTFNGTYSLVYSGGQPI